MTTPARFHTKSMLVTGAAQGIGKQVALEAAADGARLTLVDRSPLVHEVAAEINKVHGQGQAQSLEADLETWSGNEQAMAKAFRTYGAIDVLITNVGGAIWMKPFEEFGENEIMAEINRSLYPTLWGCRAVLPYMYAQNRGAIVNVSSIATKGINRIPYSAAKGAVNALTASMAFEIGARNIRINAVAPGGTTAPPRKVPRNAAKQTPQDKAWMQEVVDQTIRSSPMKRYGLLREMSAAILFLASDAASYITGTVLPVGGGDQG
ncbi:MAG: 1,6-dihydroxycyclohexa-2,4-diene-1-carboxylate dehydrogenase [Methylobacterium sp.]|nr:1,6-dihydroxycyclohexa-2,4-diene-1-carboxylate dehydrogenase [Methylobacterium sp.]MCA3604450.1 1,6-dihydroxycyclohexa-2,4-diene-1-carboxylate dehydrogenase [Methylobacterium sp.]MCA3616074.1 1,6-dihydroxycyclohexa-2,4-diene-1-carboxylate dehydrogenase [Methylobacterium sp.]MCA3625179.1 1,6-dihydroxycyclohexa-2,4-diene-1-carboxylate dehydrogenase [Methylobacterium sp.]MCA4911253.1 1,6-dihydroxycyclohexa-2,4-diene-1-carboxylate dehydrogenase [Methylobacterium sp.]